VAVESPAKREAARIRGNRITGVIFMIRSFLFWVYFSGMSFALITSITKPVPLKFVKKA
jgi:hypothetical protein